MKYRIKSKQFFSLWVSSNCENSVYVVQCKYKYLPFWINVTRGFNKLTQAEEHIRLKLKEY